MLGKIDALEIRPGRGYFNTLRFLDWYRYLNCGYRLPCVGGTDKMGAWTPPGALRAYAYLGQDEFNMDHWVDAVRRGNTFMTSGPLLLFHADGRVPGDGIALGAGGGTVEVQAEAKSYVDIHSLEVVFNGKVVAAREDRGGARQMTLKETIQVPGVGWLAARCASRPGPSVVWPYGIEAHTSPVYAPPYADPERIGLVDDDVGHQDSPLILAETRGWMGQWLKKGTPSRDPEIFRSQASWPRTRTTLPLSR